MTYTKLEKITRNVPFMWRKCKTNLKVATRIQ